ncbi:MAG: hypothetical protein ACEQSB_05755 [Undibacterium sp.]
MSFVAIFPSFNPEDIAANALELCDLFQLRREEDVPIAGYRIVYDGREHVGVVGPNKHKSALFLMFLTTMSGGMRFELTDAMRRRMADYFGLECMLAARACGSPNTTLRALLGHSVSIQIDPKPGYQSHLVSFRTSAEILAWAWERRDSITPASPEPFLRAALTGFFEDLEAKRLEMSDEPGHWPTYESGDQALELQNRLTPK